jgi:hypothetical protein
MGITLTFFPPLGPATTQGPVDPHGWDRCVINGRIVIPGFCRVLHAECKLKEDKKSKNGADGANRTYRGLDPQPVGLEITTYNDEDREELAAVLGPYIPQPGQAPKTIAIDHPSLRMLRISDVQIVGATALIPVAGTTQAKMTLQMNHALPTRNKNATTTPKGAPVRHVDNNRKKAPPPTQQPGFAAPPAALGSGQ